MTERVLPGISVPAPATPRPRPAVAAPRAATQVAHRKDAFLTTPARAGMLLGGSAAVYAVVLAGVASLQASDDAAIAARRQPWVDAIEARRVANDELERDLTTCAKQAAWLGTVYMDVSGDIAAYRASLDELGALVTQVEGSAAALPARIALPSVRIRGTVAAPRTVAPKSSATSGGSGG